MVPVITKRRKPRSDRNHVIYRITNVATGDFYIGLTVIRPGTVEKSLGIRWLGHQYKAFVERKDTRFCKAIRKYGASAFCMEALWIVRGKVAAHAHETKIVAKANPVYNTMLLSR